MTNAKDAKKDIPGTHAHGHHGAAITDALAGGAAGAAMGSLAGPPGAIVGGVIGAVVGAAAGLADESGEDERVERDAELDQEIGVDGGDLGAPNLKHPPAKIGAFSAGSMGAGGGGESNPAEGPMQDVDSKK